MAQRTQTYAIRLAVEGGGQVKAELVSVGQSGEQSLKRIESAGERASGGLKGLGRQAELLRTGIRTLGGALAGVATVGGLAALVDRSISAANAIGKTADTIGVGVEALQELRFAAKASGVEQQTLDMALQRFTRRAAEAARVPATELGIDLAGVKAIDSRGDLYVTHGITEQSFRKIDGDTLQVVASASFSSQVELATVSAYTLTGRIDFVLALGFLSAPARIFFADDLSVFWQGQNVSSRPGGLVGGPQRLRRVRGLVRSLPLDRAGQSDRHGQYPARPDGAAVHGQPGHRLSRDREAQSDHARRQRVRRGRADHQPALLRRAERSAPVHQRRSTASATWCRTAPRVASSGMCRSRVICHTRHGSPTARSAW